MMLSCNRCNPFLAFSLTSNVFFLMRIFMEQRLHGYIGYKRRKEDQP